jgi:hypothetical protein
MEVSAARGEEDEVLVGRGGVGLIFGSAGLFQTRTEGGGVEWCMLHVEGRQEWVRVWWVRGDVVDVDCRGRTRGQEERVVRVKLEGVHRRETLACYTFSFLNVDYFWTQFAAFRWVLCGRCIGTGKRASSAQQIGERLG